MRHHSIATSAWVAALLLGGSHAVAAEKDSRAVEYLCLKSPSQSLKDLAIACYTDRACNVVTARNGEPLRDYDTESVAAALGRGKIEGIVTTSARIIKEITRYKYKCTPLK